MSAAPAPILVATDFSPSSDAALGEAAALARALGAPLELMHVHPVGYASVPPTLDIASVPPSAARVGEAEAALVERLQRVRAEGVPCEGHTAFGAPAEELVRRATALRPRFLVVGTHGQSRLRHVLLGSVAERVSKQAPCAVLLVRDGGRD